MSSRCWHLVSIVMKKYIELNEDYLDDKDELKNYDKKASDPLIEYLVKVGASINKKDKYGLTPLHYACMRGK